MLIQLANVVNLDPEPLKICLNQSRLGTIISRMRIIAVKYLRDFWLLHPDAEQPLKAWADEVRKASWQHPHDVKQQYRTASILKNRRIVFNIKGNDYRLIVAVAYQFGAVYVKFIGTHAEYEAINAETISLEE